MNEQKNRKIGALISIINMIVSIIIGILYTPFVLRFLGQREYGVYSLANSLISYISVLDLGMGNSLIRYSARFMAQGKDESSLNGMFLLFYCVIAILALLLGLLISLNLHSFFSSKFTEQEIAILRKVFYILLINTVIAFPASVFSSIIRVHQKFIFANILSLIGSVIRHAVSLFCLCYGLKSVALVTVSLIITVISWLVNLYYCKYKLGIHFKIEKFEHNFYSDVFSYTFFIFINIFVDQLYSATDNVILAKICGTIEVAVYGVGVLFNSYFVNFSTSLSSVFLPHISRLSIAHDRDKKMSSVFIRVGYLQMTLLLYILVSFYCFGLNFILLWSGEEYKNAFYIAVIIMTPALVPLSQNIGISVLQALNMHRIRSMMYLVIALLNIIISIPMAQYFGGIGAAIGTAIGNIFGQIFFMNWYYCKIIHLDIYEYWKKALVCLLRMIPVLISFMLIKFMIKVYDWKGLIMQISFAVTLTFPYVYIYILKDYTVFSDHATQF